MPRVSRITPCLWFDGQAEEAAGCYVEIFPNSKIASIARYGEAGREVHGQPAGQVMTVVFELDGQSFTALNGGPMFKFNEAISLQVDCQSQQEVDFYWEKLSAGGDAQAQQCGWLKDRYGVSWQIVPRAVIDMFANPSAGNTQRAMEVMLTMKKLDVAALQRAYEG